MTEDLTSKVVDAGDFAMETAEDNENVSEHEQNENNDSSNNDVDDAFDNSNGEDDKAEAKVNQPPIAPINASKDSSRTSTAASSPAKPLTNTKASSVTSATTTTTTIIRPSASASNTLLHSVRGGRPIQMIPMPAMLRPVAIGPNGRSMLIPVARPPGGVTSPHQRSGASSNASSSGHVSPTNGVPFAPGGMLLQAPPLQNYPLILPRLAPRGAGMGGAPARSYYAPMGAVNRVRPQPSTPGIKNTQSIVRAYLNQKMAGAIVRQASYNDLGGSRKQRGRSSGGGRKRNWDDSDEDEEEDFTDTEEEAEESFDSDEDSSNGSFSAYDDDDDEDDGEYGRRRNRTKKTLKQQQNQKFPSNLNNTPHRKQKPADGDEDEFNDNRRTPSNKGNRPSLPLRSSGRAKKVKSYAEQNEDDDAMATDEDDIIVKDVAADGVSGKTASSSRKAVKSNTGSASRQSSREGSIVADFPEELEPTDEITLDDDYDVVEIVLDYRPIPEDLPEEEGAFDDTLPSLAAYEKIRDVKSECEFFIKWQARSHIHNTWETYDTLKDLKGIKKVENYIKNISSELESLPSMNAEEKEQISINLEMHRELLKEYCIIERVIAVRDGIPTEELPEPGNEYLCKWKGLSYADCTWEYGIVIGKNFQTQIDELHSRNKQSMVPGQSYNLMYSRTRPKFVKLTEQPKYLVGGSLRDYQLQGLNWLAFSWSCFNNVILADEMGLGKTIQSVSFVSYLMNTQKIYGPYLVVVPLSTISNWLKEFQKWAPGVNVLMYLGNQSSRAIIREFEFYFPGTNNLKFNVLLTTFELVLKDREVLGSIKWASLIVDEAHRLKNSESQLHDALKDFQTAHRLLITGTPLQNSIRELWNLLNFLMPHKFHDLDSFEKSYSSIEQESQINSLHEVLKPHILRRLKKDVEKSLPAKTERILRVDISPLQKTYYKWILSRNFEQLRKGQKNRQSSLLNIVNELKKAANHPFLLQDSYPVSTEDIVNNCGKMVLLDKLLTRLKADGHRVLIFSQMVKMLDILAQYMSLRGFRFQRLDGSTNSEERKHSIEKFNAPNSADFAFLLSTRAGGLGINLETADTVIIFDSDWNPQNDLQAMARAHRIGQKNTVNIYRFVSKGTVEEDILEKAKKKMVLDHLIIQRMDTSGRTILDANKGASGSQAFDKNELNQILQFGAQALFKDKNTIAAAPSDGSLKGSASASAAAKMSADEIDLDDILARAETTQGNASDSNVESSFGGGTHEDLMGQFAVADFGNFMNWEDIIPEDERLPGENDEATKNAEDDLYFTALPKRRAAAAAASSSMTTEVINNPSTGGRGKRGRGRGSSRGGKTRGTRGSGTRGRGRGRTSRRAAAEAQVSYYIESDEEVFEDEDEFIVESKKLRSLDEEDDVNVNVDADSNSNANAVSVKPVSSLEEKELRNLFRSVMRFGNAKDRFDEIISDADLETVESDALYEWIEGLIEACKKGESSYGGLSNLSHAIFNQRYNGMTLLTKYINDKHAENPVESFRFTIPSNRIKDVDGWSEEWTLEDDAKLLVGVYMYGFGDWISIKEDESLALGAKIFPLADAENNDDKENRLPQAMHLARRTDYLLKVLAEQVSIEKSSRKSRAISSRRAQRDDYEDDAYNEDIDDEVVKLAAAATSATNAAASTSTALTGRKKRTTTKTSTSTKINESEQNASSTNGVGSGSGKKKIRQKLKKPTTTQKKSSKKAKTKNDSESGQDSLEDESFSQPTTDDSY